MKRLGIIATVFCFLTCGLQSYAADFNGDGKDDFAVYEPSTEKWAVRDSFRAYFGYMALPVPGDYYGSGIADDIAVWKPKGGLWAVRGGERASVIAQEVEEVFQDWVEEIEPKGKDAELVPKGEKIKAVSLPVDFNAYIIEAIKELDSENRELEKRIVALENKSGER